MDSFGSRLRYARTAAGLTQQELADGLKVKRENISFYENDHYQPEADRIPLLARLLDVTETWLFTGDGTPPNKLERKHKKAKESSPIIPGNQLIAPGKIPVFAAAKGGDGHVIVTFDAVDYVKMPSELENVRGGYGLLITGDSMVPAFWPGDTALVNPHLQPQRSRNVILYHTPPVTGEAEAMIKQLDGWSDLQWHLKQYNPILEFSEFRAEWPVCHRVVGKYDWR